MSMNDQFWPEQEPPSAADYCSSDGHRYNGDESDRGRCYCGFKSYPIGGPTQQEGPS